MMALARALSFWISASSAATLRRQILAHLQQLGEAENRLQRVVQLVRDARHEDADGGQPLLTNDLTLQRLSSSRMRRSSATWRRARSCASRSLPTISTNELCSCSISRDGIAIGAGGLRSPATRAGEPERAIERAHVPTQHDELERAG